MNGLSRFFDSKFIKDLEKGDLPEVEVSLTTESLVNLGLTAFFVFVSALLASQIIKNMAK